MSSGLQVAPEIFEKLGNVRVFVAVLRSLDYATVNTEEIDALLSRTWASSREQTSAYPNVQSHPRIAAWRTAYTRLGVSVKKHASSIESLARRAAKPDSEPRALCPLVDFYNAASLATTLPLGGFDLDDKDIAGTMVLRLTREGDIFHALDASDALSLAPGEACYAVDNTVVTRHINWRQSREGLITETTRNVAFMAEILPEVGDDAISDVKTFFSEHCRPLLGVDASLVAVLDKANTHISY
jgi:DNA/RNA-binding domain of Phe-tRNA-synthetase-like protein